MQAVWTLFRIAALTVLLAGAVLAAIGQHPRAADYSEFTAALNRGEVERVVLPASQSSPEVVHTAAWSTGPLEWREGAVAPPATTNDQFFPAMDSRGVAVHSDHGDADGIFDWPFWSPALWFGNVLAGLWLAAFLAMLFSRPRFGNRWAWFWLFTVGQIGVFLYLVLEPRPLWRAPTGDDLVPITADADATPDRRWTGGQGCLMSILAAIAAPMLSGAVGWAAGHVLP